MFVFAFSPLNTGKVLVISFRGVFLLSFGTIFVDRDYFRNLVWSVRKTIAKAPCLAQKSRDGI